MGTKNPQPNTLYPAGYEDNNSNSDESDGMVASHEALLPHSDTQHNTGLKNQPPKGPAVFPKMPENEEKIEVVSDGISPMRKYASVFVLFLINLLNYMDRFTIAGVLMQIQEYFNISNGSAGLLQTVFIISYMAVAPLFGFLGDRYNRKLVMLAGMIVWSGCTLFASFVNNQSHFLLFLVLRGLVGIGEASYSTIAPTIIADLFVKEKRTNMLSVFYFAIPVGSGLGYIIGSAAAQAFGSWHWALRITPGLGLITMALMMVVIPNPKRGASEANNTIETTGKLERETSYKEDLIYILKNKSFICVTIGFTFMAFVVGSLTIWGPIFVAYSQVVTGTLQPCTDDNCEYGDVSFVFGLITCVAGFIGVWAGAEWSKRWKARGQKNADALVCAIGLVIAAPLLLAGFQLATINLPSAWTFIFLADLAQCLTWTLVGDMTLYVTMPSRRSTANAVQILTMHLFGDAGSPYLLGVLSDAITANLPATYYSKYLGLQRAMYVALFASVLGGCGFLMASLFIVRDKKKVDDALAGLLPVSCSPNSDSSGSVELEQISSDDNSSDPLIKPTPVIDNTNEYMEPSGQYMSGQLESFYTTKDEETNEKKQNNHLNSKDSSPKVEQQGYISVGEPKQNFQEPKNKKYAAQTEEWYATDKPQSGDKGLNVSESSSVTSNVCLLDAKESLI
nr:protein spinster homolog 1 isoform X1 [Ciona intestinalis]|eukprot:XP_002119843.1 protein spinster homolog 1 isoform X1 [Ciona intestinalis]